MTKIVAFDIETLERLHIVPLPPITCICLLDNEENKEYKLRFWKISADEYETNKKIVIDLLDNASCIIGYNAVLFDLEFIKQSFGISETKMTKWVCKTIDLFMLCKYVLKSTCKLDTLLTINKLSNKTGSGKDAITLAMDERWQELLDYCMSDTRLTMSLFSECPSIQVSDVLQVKWMIFSDGDRFPKLEWKQDNKLYTVNKTEIFDSIALPFIDDVTYEEHR